MNYAQLVKETLIGKIREMSQYPWLFAQNPEKDFTRKRKLTFETMLKMLLSFEGGSLGKELLEFSKFSLDTATVSAFVQQREKILPEAFQFLFYEFNEAFMEYPTYCGYRLLAGDGSRLNIAHNPDDETTYFQNNSSVRGFNQLHLNALYDLCARRYVDAVIQRGRQMDERSALTTMIDRYQGGSKTIFIADRNYESYNVFAHIEQKGFYYLIRIKDMLSNGMASGFALPKQDDFDVDIRCILSKKQTKAQPQLYKFSPASSSLDDADLDLHKYYPITLRILRFPIGDREFECIATNLSRDDFPDHVIQKMYTFRWGIETSFRELKYAIGLTCFHAKKVTYIMQEIWARLVLYNFCEIITAHVILQQKNTKHVYQVNFTLAIHICRIFLRCFNNPHPSDVIALIRKNILPVRFGRSNPRKVKPKSAVSFLYRTT